MHVGATLHRLGSTVSISKRVRDWKDGGVVNACNTRASKIVMSLERFHYPGVASVPRQSRCGQGFVHMWVSGRFSTQLRARPFNQFWLWKWHSHRGYGGPFLKISPPWRGGKGSLEGGARSEGGSAAKKGLVFYRFFTLMWKNAVKYQDGLQMQNQLHRENPHIEPFIK